MFSCHTLSDCSYPVDLQRNVSAAQQKNKRRTEHADIVCCNINYIYAISRGRTISMQYQEAVKSMIGGKDNVIF